MHSVLNVHQITKDMLPSITHLIDKAYGYGYRNLGFILDRGYFRRKNLSYIDQHGYSFLIMVKGMKDLVRSAVLDHRGTFESSRAKYIEQYDLYGITMETKLFDNEEKRRHLHIYYSDGSAYSEKQELKQKIKRLKGYLNACVGKRCNPFGLDNICVRCQAKEIEKALKTND